MEIAWGIFLALIGAACGSFVGAMTWRMHYNNEIGTKKSKTKSKKNTTRKPEKLSWVNGRSQCEHCGHQLAWYDLLPIVSWLWLKGKCRYCGKKIGWTAIALEIGVGAAFVVSFLFWPATSQAGPVGQPVQAVGFLLWLITVVLMAALLVYDARWRLLLDKLLWPLIGVVFVWNVISFVVCATHGWSVALGYLGDIALALIPVFGLYLVLYLISRGRWVGFGDVKFGIVVALILADWKMATLVLIGANVLGTLLVLPSLVMKKLNVNSQIAFGPFLILATFLTFLFGRPLIEWATKYLFFV